MSEKYELVDLGKAFFGFAFEDLAQIIRNKIYDGIGGFLLALNIIAVGFAAAFCGDQFSFFFPSLDPSITFANAFIIGLFFQSVVVLVYSALQSFLLELFNTNVSFDRALIMIGYAGFWFIPAALLVHISLITSFAFAFLSFGTLVMIIKEYSAVEFTQSFLGVGFVSLITGIISVTLSLLIGLAV